MTSNTELLLVIFVGLTGVAVLLQACVLIGIFVSMRKSAKLITDATDELKTTIMPMVHSTRHLVERISPEVVTVTDGLAELTTTLRKESENVHISPADLINGIKHQTKRIDAMLTLVLDRIEGAGSALESTVAAPVRQVNGVLAAIKATIETYRSYPRSERPEPSTSSRAYSASAAYARGSEAPSYPAPPSQVSEPDLNRRPITAVEPDLQSSRAGIDPKL